MATYPNTTTANGTVEQIDGRYVLRYERHLPHSMDRVWAALTEPDQLEMWLARAEIDLVQGGRVVLRWLNTDTEGNYAVARGTITQLEPPQLLEIDTDIHGLLRWQLRSDGDGCALTFSSTVALAEEWLPIVLAGWHAHLDFLADALEGRAVDWPNWPRDHWEELHAEYAARLGSNGA
jgi:uncharacterized protein YndB with AHSA1/START domain